MGDLRSRKSGVPSILWFKKITRGFKETFHTNGKGLSTTPDRACRTGCNGRLVIFTLSLEKIAGPRPTIGRTDSRPASKCIILRSDDRWKK
jgi:hypothetical protein